MSPRLERAALPKLLAHPAYRRHAKTEKLGNLASALASLVELENPPPHRDRNGSHGPTLSHNHVSVKLHHLWKCSNRHFMLFLTASMIYLPGVKRKPLFDEKMARTGAKFVLKFLGVLFVCLVGAHLACSQ